MHPMLMALEFEHWLYLALSVVGVVLEVWAVVHCVTRSGEQFERAGQRPKSFWLLLTGIAAVVGVLSLSGSFALGGGFGLFQIAALCVAGVYLAGPREELKITGRGGSTHYGY